MGTEGTVSVVADGHYYAHRQAYDMVPKGHLSALMDEAATISESAEWPAVAAGWINKAWLDAEDEHMHEHLRHSVKHPDGDTARNRWVDAMRPRLSYHEMRNAPEPLAGLHDWADRVFETPHGPAENRPGASIVGSPSWRAAADMAVMAKAPIELADARYAIIADVDVGRLICYGRTEGGVVVSVDLSDSAALRLAAQTARAHENTFPEPPGELEWRREVRALHSDKWSDPPKDADHDLKDGMWARPAGFPPLAGTPATYPGGADKPGIGL